RQVEDCARRSAEVDPAGPPAGAVGPPKVAFLIDEEDLARRLDEAGGINQVRAQSPGAGLGAVRDPEVGSRDHGPDPQAREARDLGGPVVRPAGPDLPRSLYAAVGAPEPAALSIPAVGRDERAAPEAHEQRPGRGLSPEAVHGPGSVDRPVARPQRPAQGSGVGAEEPVAAGHGSLAVKAEIG